MFTDVGWVGFLPPYKKGWVFVKIANTGRLVLYSPRVKYYY